MSTKKLNEIGLWLLDKLTKELKDQSPITLTSALGHMKEINLIFGARSSAAPVIFPDMPGKGQL